MFKNKNKKKDNTKVRTSSFRLKSIPVRENGDNYYYIENFEQATDKQCKEYDKLNQLIFQKYNGIYDKISNKIGDCPFKLDKKPEPPKSPNNYESLLKWRAMNTSENVSHQTIATLYLLKHKFILSLDFDKEGIKPSEIIDIALKETNNDMELMKSEGYEFLKSLNLKKEDISQISTNKKKIKKFRSKTRLGSTSGSSNTDNLSSSSSSIEIDFGFKNNYINPDNNQYQNNNQTDNCNQNNQSNIVKRISNINLHMVNPNQYNNNNYNNSPELNIQQPKIQQSKIQQSKIQQSNIQQPNIQQPNIQQSNIQQPNLPQINNIHMKCDRPEHHNIREKVNHFNNLYPTISNSNYNPQPYNPLQHNHQFEPQYNIYNSSVNNNEEVSPEPSAPPDYNC